MQNSSENSNTQQLGATAFTQPQINLPKGGGAIRGIDEKFAANPVTGSGSLAIPIAASPSRSGFGPQLSLNYDSSAGNGAFGMGWSLSLPSITRRTDKGVPRYRDAEESDIFILSGAEDLVPVMVLDAAGRWVPDQFEQQGYRVKRYRPRIEGLFARIERWIPMESCLGAEHWRSISKDNILTVYGFDADARIADPEDPRRIFSWLICRSYDDKGNAIVYDYVAENDAGVDLAQANERNRIRSANRYPRRIRYGNREPLLLDSQTPSFRRCHLETEELQTTDWMFELVFDYAEDRYLEETSDQAGGQILAQASTVPARIWPVRADPFSTYRAGFEIRTYRLCRRVLMFHHFSELGVKACLVRSTAFEYCEKPFGSFITQVVQAGHTREVDGRYLTRMLPPLDLTYSASPLEDPDFSAYSLKEVAENSLNNLPGGIDGDNYRWLDLNGEGIAGILTEQDNTWYYKPNLGEGRFGATQTVKTRPSLAALNNGKQMLMDVGGEGCLDLVDLFPAAAGFQSRTLDGEGWGSFHPFPSLPVRDWNDPNLRFVDLSGDGVADILISENDAMIWHRSLLKAGFAPGLRVRIPLEEQKGARIIFADSEQSIYLADMTGDGLSDIVRIRNRQICYWPNLGYGCFGAKVTMDHAPQFDETDQFSQKRIRLADTDGSGTADIIYLGRNGVCIYLNLMGNAWSSVRRLRGFPPIDDVGAITVADFLGRGTACLLWSSALPRAEGRQLRYVDLMCGQKPHLLISAANNLGAETHIEYASSTEFYLADKLDGRPWVTKLPFPVQVVKKVETYDYISRNRFVSRYSYHHGFYDGLEREFRGFGRVDQLDTEELATLKYSDAFPVGENMAMGNLPPVLTKTWFHTGVYLQGRQISRHMAREYYQEGGGSSPGEAKFSPEQIRAMQLEDVVLPEQLSAEEAREACRSLKGAVLRQEVYAIDAKPESSRPYTVTENNYAIRKVQPKLDNRHAVFFTHARESLSFNYERKLYKIDDCLRADPRVTHSVTLQVDDFGNVRQAAAIGYGRRFAERSHLLNHTDREKQAQTLLTLTENCYTNSVQERDAYRAPLPVESRLYQLNKLTPASKLPDITNLFRFQELAEQIAQAGDGRHDLAYEDWRALGAVENRPYRRLLKQSRNQYRASRLTRLLPFGALEALALPGRSYQLAFTPSLLDVYKRSEVGQVVEDLLPNAAAVLADSGADGGGYVDLDGDGRWWSPGGAVFFHPDPQTAASVELEQALKHFFLPRRFEDQFGYSTTVDFDKHDLLTVRSVDAYSNSVSAENDYRVLQASLVTDPNGNRAAVVFDALGLVAGSAVMGKHTEKLGDSLAGFRADLSQSEIDDFFANPKGATAAGLLGLATARIVYDTQRYYRTRSAQVDGRRPAYAATLARETHVSDLKADELSKIQVSFSYADGFGRVIQNKIQAEPGPLQPGESPVNKRWVGNGWTVFNNKGNPIRQYEPFFDASHDFRFGNRVGASSILFYDPPGRLVATLNPDHSWQKVVFDPWRQASWDVNDTVLIDDPAVDADVGAYFHLLPAADYLPTWYQQRISGNLGAEQQTAARKTGLHAATPSLVYADSLGRAVLSLAHNRSKQFAAGPLEPVTEEFYATRVIFDIEGRQREIIDAHQRIVMRYDYNLLGKQLYLASMEAGERWLLCDATGSPIRAWDSRKNCYRTLYDRLRRATDTFLRTGQGAELLVQRSVYGETQAAPETNNLRGKMLRVYDQAGVVISDCYDYKDNLLRSQRQLACEYKQTLNWAAKVELEATLYTSRSRYDALNRPIELVSPDHSKTRPYYNEANLLTRIEVNLRGSPVATAFVKNIEYNAKGQRCLIEYGNGAKTRYAYDALTFRLHNLQTARNKQVFPDDCPHPSQPGWPGCLLQNLSYTYDPSGNITHIRDNAQQSVYFRNRRVEPSNDYSYDAVYRLIEASGREHLGQIGSAPTAYNVNDELRVGLLQPGDGNALARYTEQYLYDAVGNILAMQHRGADALQPGWKRTYAYHETSQLEADKTNNRLSKTQVGQTIEHYRYQDSAGLHGDVTTMPHLALMQWDYRDQLKATARQVFHAGEPETTWYVYDATGQRVRKVTERQCATGETPTRRQERIYLGDFEIYREYANDGLSIDLERETLHISDDNQRIALIETKTISRPNDTSAAQLIRYQFGNHLGSACLELDDQAKIISYEEYSPYGSSTYQAVKSRTETPKRYRYVGKERDEENGFYYYGARYYMPWLARWTACDPIGVADGLNLYSYVRGNPVCAVDIDGFLTSDGDAGAPTPGGGNTDVAGAPLPPPDPADAQPYVKSPLEEYYNDPAYHNIAGPPPPPDSKDSSDQESSDQESEDTDMPESSAKAVPENKPLPPNNNRWETDTPIIPFFIKDYFGGWGWRQYVRAYQDPGPGAPVGLSALRQLNAGAPLAVAQFSRDHSPGTSIENLTVLTVEAIGAAGSAVSAASQASKLTPALFAVDEAMKTGDEVAGVLVNGRYIKNPTTRNLAELITETGKIGGKKMSGKFMYVVDEAGNIFIGSRAGQRMPHPTLIGGANPRVQAAGIIDIRGGRIYSVNTASGHFKPGIEALAAAKRAFARFGANTFHKNFEGFVLH